MKFKGLCTMIALVACTAGGGLYAQEYSQDFVGGQAPPEEACPKWVAFHAELVEQDYTRLTIKGTFDEEGRVCTDPDIIAQIAKALNTDNQARQSWECDGNTWQTVGCGGRVELSANQGCVCATPGYTMRPCRVDPLWGGVNTPTCNGPTQTVMVIFEGGGGNCSYVIKKSQGKGGCDVCPAEGEEFETQAECEIREDCRKRLKTKINCPEGEGLCKIKGKKRSCPGGSGRAACCFNNGRCKNIARSECEDGGGRWNLGKDCRSFDCPQPGACCLDNSTCEIALERSCNERGGDFKGVGEKCKLACPCDLIKSFEAKCTGDGTIEALVTFKNDSRNGETVTIQVGERLKVEVPIRGNKARLLRCCFDGSVEVTLIDPDGCEDPIVVDCPE